MKPSINIIKSSMATYLLTVILLCITSITCKRDEPIPVESINIQIPNGDFENWSWVPLPENWKTNSYPLSMAQWVTYIVKKDSQVVYHGAYSMKLIYNLTPPAWGAAPAWAKNKFAISEHPNNLRGYLKCNLQGTDTVSISVKILNNGITVDSGQWKSTVSIINWTEVNIPISNSSTVIDSALITITGGKYKDSTTTLANSTTFWVDQLYLIKY